MDSKLSTNSLVNSYPVMTSEYNPIIKILGTNQVNETNSLDSSSQSIKESELLHEFNSEYRNINHIKNDRHLEPKLENNHRNISKDINHLHINENYDELDNDTSSEKITKISSINQTSYSEQKIYNFKTSTLLEGSQIDENKSETEVKITPKKRLQVNISDLDNSQSDSESNLDEEKALERIKDLYDELNELEILENDLKNKQNNEGMTRVPSSRIECNYYVGTSEGCLWKLTSSMTDISNDVVSVLLYEQGSSICHVALLEDNLMLSLDKSDRICIYNKSTMKEKLCIASMIDSPVAGSVHAGVLTILTANGKGYSVRLNALIKHKNLNQKSLDSICKQFKLDGEILCSSTSPCSNFLSAVTKSRKLWIIECSSGKPVTISTLLPVSETHFSYMPVIAMYKYGILCGEGNTLYINCFGTELKVLEVFEKDDPIKAVGWMYDTPCDFDLDIAVVISRKGKILWSKNQDCEKINQWKELQKPKELNDRISSIIITPNSIFISTKSSSFYWTKQFEWKITPALKFTVGVGN